MKVRSRFAPSPTGMLHIGNARTAVMNWLFTKHYNGTFIVRIDDTDLERSKKEYEEAIFSDLRWMGIVWDDTFAQSKRLERYDEIKGMMIQIGRLYPCYETPEELDLKRKIQLSSDKPPIYDRAALSLSNEQVNKYISAGRKPHYRFKLDANAIVWDDMIKGQLRYDPMHISDPIVIREDGSMTYMLCSVIDDIDYDITHIIRGEDHITNTAVQIQMFGVIFDLLKQPSNSITFGHLGLVKSKDEKISKRVGGFDIASLRDVECIESFALLSFINFLGYNKSYDAHSIDDLIEQFDISACSIGGTTYAVDDLIRMNHKFLFAASYDSIKGRLMELGYSAIDERFWNVIKSNISTLKDAKLWCDIVYGYELCDNHFSSDDRVFLRAAMNCFPDDLDAKLIWNEWRARLISATGRGGKELVMPLRLAITNLAHGPEMSNLIQIIGIEEVKRRIMHNF